MAKRWTLAATAVLAEQYVEAKMQDPEINAQWKDLSHRFPHCAALVLSIANNDPFGLQVLKFIHTSVSARKIDTAINKGENYSKVELLDDGDDDGDVDETRTNKRKKMADVDQLLLDSAQI